LKKIQSSHVKRVSSTTPASLPTREMDEIAPEIVDSMISQPNATAAAAGGKPATGRVVLPVSCTIHEVHTLRTHLLEQLELPGPCEIDGSAVQQVDTAGVQLVLAFALDCLERSLQYAWKGRSAPLEEAIRVLGVGALLEYPA
jgi:ABC-type transporter Mla MlaB component